MSIEMSGSLGGSYLNSIGNQINAILKDLAGTNKIVIDIFKKLDDYKAEVDKSIVKDMLKKAAEKIERLRGQIKNMTPALENSITKIEKQIDDLKQQLQIT